jgi:DNA-binding winged helix-turn-helix (wHTH) protein
LRYAFDDLVLDTDRRELRRGDALLAVEPLVFDILTLLIRNRERVVSKEELRTEIWGGRIVSESTLTSCMTNVRGAAGDNGSDQRLIKTIARRGFRFVGPVREEAEADKQADPPVTAPSGEAEPSLVPVQAGTSLKENEGTSVVSEPPAHAQLPVSVAPTRSRWLIVIGLAALIVAAGLLRLSLNRFHFAATPQALRPFDAAKVPIVNDATRERLARYSNRADFKALAIATDGLGIADGEVDEDSAKREALRLCGTTAKRPCRIYAVGNNVVWPDDVMPMPAAGDLRVEPLDIPLTADALTFAPPEDARSLAGKFLPAANHKALATIGGGAAWFVFRQRSRGEAVRRVSEQCATVFTRPCLLISVDGFLTLQIPKTRRISGIFLPSTEPSLAGPERDRIAAVYQGKEWRAIARGGNGSLHAIAGAASEDEAIAAALKACAEADRDCRLYAIGNFRIAD